MIHAERERAISKASKLRGMRGLEEVMRAKELNESFLDEFGKWLGYPLR